jgi:hypothetical protein
VRPMTVIVRRVAPQNCAEMALAIDQHPVRALGPDCPYPAFGITVVPYRQLHPVRMIGTDASV